MAEYTMRIPDWRPALDNELIGCHPKTAGKRKKATTEFIMAYGRVAGVTPARGPRRVRLEIVYPGKRTCCDPTAPWKSLLDALVNSGFLIGDARGDYEAEPTDVHNGGTRLMTIITLTDLY